MSDNGFYRSLFLCRQSLLCQPCDIRRLSMYTVFTVLVVDLRARD